MRPFVVRSLLIVFLCGFSSVSQSQSNAPDTAVLSGTLTDPSGAVISGGQVSVSALDAGKPGRELLRILSGKDGRYTAAVPTEHCCFLRVTHPSFVTQEEAVRVAPGESRTVDFLLQINPLASTIVVTAQAEPASADSTPAPVTVLTHEDIERRQSVSLPDLLATQPGITLARTGPEGGLATIFIDGGNSNFTKLLVDGAPVTWAGRQINFSNFTLDNVDKIEIVHGAESTLYGSDAVAGAIQVISHRGTTRIPEVTLFADGGSFSSARGGAQVSGLAGRFDYSAAASYFETAGQGPNDFFLNRSFAGNFGWKFHEENELRMVLRSNASDAGIPGQTLLLPPSLNQHDNFKNLSAIASWEFHTGSHWRSRVSGSEDRIVDRNANPPFFSSQDQFNRAGVQAQSTYLRQRGAFTAGYEYEVENAFPSLLGGQHARRNNQAGYLDGRWQPLTRLTLSAGGRAAANTTFGTRVVPRAGAVYLLRSGDNTWGATRLRFSYGQGIKEPEMEQSFGTDPCFPGNPALRAERSRTINAGVEQLFAADRVRLSANYFDNRFRDIISFAFDPLGTPACPFGLGTNFNTDLARARGANVTTEARPVHWLAILGNYSYDDTRVLKAPNAFDPVEAPGNRLIRRPLHSGNLVLNASFAKMNWNLAGYFSGRRTDSDFLGLGLTSNPGYARFDLATSYAVSQGVSVTGRVANLFDKQYQEAIGFPALGREVRVGVKYTFHRE